MAGNIVIFEEEGKPPHAFWLQRKVAKTLHGCVRVGFLLRPNSSPDFKGVLEAWELAPDDAGRHQIVAMKMMDTSILNMNQDSESTKCVLHNPLNEISALQMIANFGTDEELNVIGSKLIATSSQHVYVILPYHRDGTLFQFCLSQGTLKEAAARFFFRRILKVSNFV